MLDDRHVTAESVDERFKRFEAWFAEYVRVDDVWRVAARRQPCRDLGCAEAAGLADAVARHRVAHRPERIALAAEIDVRQPARGMRGEMAQQDRADAVAR